MKKEYVSETHWLKQLTSETERPCIKENRPIILGLSEKDNVAMGVRPNCKCWDCIACAARNAKRWIARIIHGVNNMDTVDGWHMFTLTAHEAWRGRDRSVKNLRQGWKKLYNRMRREFGISHYAKVWEQHMDGTYHLHGLIDCVIPQRWLKDNARACGMGYQVEIHPVDNAGQVAGYIAKYFLKSADELFMTGTWVKNLRRIEVSRSWIKLPDLKNDEWQWMLAESENFSSWWLNRQREKGREVIDRTAIEPEKMLP